MSVYHKKSQNSVGIEYVNRINGDRLSKPDQSKQSGLVSCIGKLGILTWTRIGTSTILLSWDCKNRKTLLHLNFLNTNMHKNICMKI